MFYIVITNDIIFTFATIRVILENFHDDDETWLRMCKVACYDGSFCEVFSYPDKLRGFSKGLAMYIQLYRCVLWNGWLKPGGPYSFVMDPSTWCVVFILGLGLGVLRFGVSRSKGFLRTWRTLLRRLVLVQQCRDTSAAMLVWIEKVCCTPLHVYIATGVPPVFVVYVTSWCQALYWFRHVWLLSRIIRGAWSSAWV